MLQALPSTRQNEGEATRRWFFSYAFDLYVWYDVNSKPNAFQLAYAKPWREHSISWHHERGFRHYRVDEGEGVFGLKVTPILIPNGPIDQETLLREFVDEAEELPDDVRELVIGQLGSFKPSAPDPERKQA
jgi:hypothetical protein